MELEVALQEFETECKKIDNLVIMPNLSKKDIFKILQPVIRKYLDIANKTSATDPVFLKAQAKLLKLAEKRQEFKDVVESIIPSKSVIKIDKKMIVNVINNLVQDFKYAKSNGTFEASISELESRLNDCYQLVQDEKNLFTQEQFDKLNGIMDVLFENVNKYKGDTVTLKYANSGFTKLGIVCAIALIATVGMIILGILLS